MTLLIRSVARYAQRSGFESVARRASRPLLSSHVLRQAPQAARATPQRHFSAPPKQGLSGMSKAMKVGLCLFATGIGITVSLKAAEKPKASIKAVDHMRLDVTQAIAKVTEIPGLKPEEVIAFKAEILKAWETLLRNGVYKASGPDKDIRPSFVALQGIIEHVLSCKLKKEVRTLQAWIHTPMPATPLCTTGEISPELVDPTIEKDPKRLFTVKARTTIVRDFLHQGGDLFVVYPRDGLSKRTEAQLAVYRQALQQYPQHLFDQPISCTSIPNELIGATYLFRDQDGKEYIFAINMTQANDPKAQGNFGLWFGPKEHPAVKERVEAVFSFIEKNKATE